MFTVIVIIIVLVLFGAFLIWLFVTIMRESWKYAKKINRLVDITLDDDRLNEEEKKIRGNK